MADNSPVRKLSARMVLETTQWEDGVEKVKKKTLNLSTTTSQSMEAVKGAYSKVAKSVNVTENALDDLEAEARKTRAEIQRSERQYQKFKEEMERAQLMVGKTADEQQILSAQLRLGKGATQAQKDEVARLITQYNNLNASTGKTRHGFRAMRNSFSQIQYQMQDIAVQLQSNTSPFIILSQQGSQIASLFGPWGAVLGSVLAFSGMLGGTLTSSLLSGKDAGDKFADSMEAVNNIIQDSDDNANTLNDSFNTVVETFGFLNRSVSQVAIKAQMDANKQAVDGLVDSFDDIKDQLATTKVEIANGYHPILGDQVSFTKEATAANVGLRNAIAELGKEVSEDNIKQAVIAWDFYKKTTKENTEELREFDQQFNKYIAGLIEGNKRINEIRTGGVVTQSEDEDNDAKNKIEDEIKALENKARLVDEGTLTRERLGYDDLTASQQARIDLALYEIELIKEQTEQEEQAAKSRQEARKLENKGSNYLYELQSQYEVLQGLPERNDQWLESLKDTNNELYNQIVTLRELVAVKKAETQAEQVAINAKNQMTQATRQSFATLAQVAEEGSELQKLALIGEQMSAAASVWFSAAAASMKIDEKYAAVPGGPALAATEKAAIETNKWVQLGAIAAQTVAGVFHDGGEIPDDGTYLLQGKEYVESHAERRNLDSILNKVNSLASGGGMNLYLTQHIATIDQLDANQVFARSSEAIYRAFNMAKRKRGIKA